MENLAVRAAATGRMYSLRRSVRATFEYSSLASFPASQQLSNYPKSRRYDLPLPARLSLRIGRPATRRTLGGSTTDWADIWMLLSWGIMPVTGIPGVLPTPSANFDAKMPIKPRSVPRSLVVIHICISVGDDFPVSLVDHLTFLTMVVCLARYLGLHSSTVEACLSGVSILMSGFVEGLLVCFVGLDILLSGFLPWSLGDIGTCRQAKGTSNNT
ncbi:hypothetical protein BDV24DRAFT_123018 [Aspergillus arachidicola]|uniref:Uncharacterized protein n=1 Tax=Aspergillus arachidicola TaxID=656916 RepID=A0A5N6YQ60_9EURO|nr:hypothetical protein BDV24DRAFT_123018 [Aspergillus arachidicola]